MSENGEIYTTGKKIALPPAVTTLTNLTSGLPITFELSFFLDGTHSDFRRLDWIGLDWLASTYVATTLLRIVHRPKFGLQGHLGSNIIGTQLQNSWVEKGQLLCFKPKNRFFDKNKQTTLYSEIGLGACGNAWSLPAMLVCNMLILNLPTNIYKSSNN